MPRKTSDSPTESATSGAEPAESSNYSSLDNTIASVVPRGDLRASLFAIRDRLAAETDDLRWAQHKRECNCVCGMTDPRSLVALTKRLEETLAAIEALPKVAKEESAVDRVIAATAKRRDELAARRAGRESGSSAS